MENEITQQQYHELLAVLLDGSKNFETYVRTSTLVFPSITPEQREFYFTSFHAMKAVSALLQGNNVSEEEFDKLMEEAGDFLLKEAPSSQPFPDNVTPIKH